MVVEWGKRKKTGTKERLGFSGGTVGMSIEKEVSTGALSTHARWCVIVYVLVRRFVLVGDRYASGS